MDDTRTADDMQDEPRVDLVVLRVQSILLNGAAWAYGYTPPEQRPGYDPEDPS